MRKKLKFKSSKLRIFLFVLVFSLFTFHFSLLTCLAKVYIDISSPAFRKLPVAIEEFAGPSGKEITDIIKNDLEFTGLFTYVDKAAYLESSSQPFNQKNWTPLGVEAVVKGTTRQAGDIVVTVSLYDVFEAKEIFSKEYRAEKGLLRPLAHSVANDIYSSLTGESGIFRSRIVFVGDDRGGRAIFMADWDGGRIRNTGLRGNIILSPHWSKDGSKLIYSAERNRQWDIYLVDFSSMREKKVFSSKGTNLAGDFAPEGNAFAFSSSKDGTPDLFIMDLTNKKVTRLISSYGIEVSPVFSPDSRHIAFVSDRGGSPQIYTMKRDGSEVRRITFEGSYNTSPCWSPKGDKIVFSGRRGTNQIFTVNPDGTGLTQLTSQGSNEDPSFSPDGRYITFSSDRDGGKGIYIMRANGESQNRITPRSMRASNPRWSPN
jgi:TolB protein